MSRLLRCFVFAFALMDSHRVDAQCFLVGCCPQPIARMRIAVPAEDFALIGELCAVWFFELKISRFRAAVPLDIFSGFTFVIFWSALTVRRTLGLDDSDFHVIVRKVVSQMQFHRSPARDENSLAVATVEVIFIRSFPVL